MTRSGDVRNFLEQVASLKRERDKFAIALARAIDALDDVRSVAINPSECSPGDRDRRLELIVSYVSRVRDKLDDPSACLKAHDEAKDYFLRLASEHRDELEAKIRQLQNMP